MTSPVSQILHANLTAIIGEIHAACGRAGRSPNEVRLVVVTKYADWVWAEELSRLHDTFGENRPQQLADRQVRLPNVDWHLIGQLQRNKAKLAVQHAAMIHSVDSMKLLEKISETASSLNVRPEILLQVNISGEATKSGFSPEGLVNHWSDILMWRNFFQLGGLMTIAPDTDDPESARPWFRLLRQLRDQLASRSDSRQAGLLLPELSMGMSGDFVPAIEEGATLVRIGSRVFAGLDSTNTVASQVEVQSNPVTERTTNLGSND
jgi:pyridoxal phosphate enzyme (YggS family)